jgi:hypothetical protein
MEDLIVPKLSYVLGYHSTILMINITVLCDVKPCHF